MGGIVLALVAVVLLVGIALNTPPGKRLLVSVARREVPGLAVGSLTGVLPFTVHVRDLTIDDIYGEPVLRARTIDVRLSPFAVVRHVVRIDDVSVSDALFYSAPARDGRSRVAAITPGPPAAPSGPSRWTVEVGALALRDTRVRVLDAAGVETAVADVAMSASGLAHGPAVGTRGRVDPLEVRFTLPPAGVKGELHLSVERGLGVVARGDGWIGADGAGDDERTLFRVRALGPDASVALETRVDTPGGGMSLNGVIDLAARPIGYQMVGLVGALDPRTVLATLPAGTVDAQVRVDGRGVPLAPGSHVAGALVASPSRVGPTRIDAIAASLATHGARWQLRRLVATTSGAAVTAAAEGSHASLEGRVDLRAAGARFAAGALGEGQATGEGHATLSRTAAGDLSVNAGGSFADVRVGAWAARGLDVRLSLTDWPRRPAGRFDLRLAAATVAQGALEGVEQHARLEPDAFTTELSARLRPRGGRPSPLLARARVPLARGPDGTVRPSRRGTLTAEVRVPPTALPALGSPAATAGWASLEAQVSGTLATPIVRARARLRGATIAGRDALSATLTVNADERGAGLHLDARRARVFRARVDATTPVPLSELAARHRALPLSGRVHVDGSTAAMAAGPIKEEGAARITADASLGGTTAHPRLDANGSLAGPTLPTLAFATHLAPRGAGFELDGQLTSRGVEVARLAVSSPRPLRGGLAATRGSLVVHAPELDAVTPPALGVTGSLDVLVEVARLGGRQRSLRAVVDAGAVHLKGKEVGRLHADASMDGREGHVALALEQSRGSLGLLATLADGELAIRGQAHEVDLAGLREVNEVAQRVVGTVSGDFTARGVVTPGRDDTLVDLDRVVLEHGRVAVAASSERGEGGQKGVEAPKVRAEDVRETQKTAKAGSPVRVRRLEVRDSEVDVVDVAGPGKPLLRVHGIEASLENFANRRELLGGKPTVLAMRAEIERTGELVTFATLDPVASSPRLAGQAHLEVALADLGQFLAARGGLDARSGWFDCYVQFHVANGQVKGGIKPILIHGDVSPAHRSVTSVAKAAVSKIALGLFSSREPGRDAVAATVPIAGKLENPDVQLVPTVLGVLRNAFVLGLGSGFGNLPPPTAPGRESIFEQAARALSPSGDPPRAQPPAPEQRGG